MKFILPVLLVGCASDDPWFKHPFYEIEVRDPKGVLSGRNAQLTVSSRPDPMSSSARARTKYSEADQTYRIESLLHERRQGWLLASPDITAPYHEVKH